MNWTGSSRKPAGIDTGPHWLRTLIACGLAPFLVGLVIIAQPPSGYLAESQVIVCEENSGKTDWAAHLVSDEFLVDVLSTMEIHTTGDRAADAVSVSEELTGWFRSRLTVRPDTSNEQEEMHLTIQFTGDSPEQAVDMVDRVVEIAQRQSLSKSPSVPESHSAMQKAIEQSQRVVDRDWQRLRELIDRQTLRFEDLAAELAVAHQMKTEKPSEPETPTPPLDSFSHATKTLINPAWSRLNEHQQGLLLRREQLLTRLTPAHPEMVDLEQELLRTEQQILAEPKFLDDSPRNDYEPKAGPDILNARPNPDAVEGVSALEWPPAAPTPDSDAKLPNQCRQAVDQLVKSHEAHTATVKRQIQIASTSSDSTCFVATNASSVKQVVYPALQLLLILLVGGVGLMFGGLMVGLTTLLNRRPLPLASAQQVSDQLGVPVVADITPNDPIKVHQVHTKLSTWLWRTAFLCEVVVIVLLGAFFISGFVGSDIAAGCLSDPLSGFGNAIRQLFSLN